MLSLFCDLIVFDPDKMLNIKFREPVILPKTIPLSTVENFLSIIYRERKQANTDYQKRNAA